MAKLIYSRRALADLDRLVDFLLDLALHSDEQEQDTVIVLAIRHQREAGYTLE